MNEDHEHERNGGCGRDGPQTTTAYCVNIEGTEHPWTHPAITSEQIAQLGGWDASQGVVEILPDNTERTMSRGESIRLQLGHGFCRRVRWKRGFVRSERIDAEIALLRRHYPRLERNGDWIRLPEMTLTPDWAPNPTSFAFQLADTFPGTAPYGLYVPAGLRWKGQTPRDYTEPAANAPPFGGAWGMFSWTVVDPNDWRPSSSVEKGVNLVQWVSGFRQRFAEGA